MNIRLANHDHVVATVGDFLIVDYQDRFYVYLGSWRVRMAGCETVEKARRRINAKFGGQA